MRPLSTSAQVFLHRPCDHISLPRQGWRIHRFRASALGWIGLLLLTALPLGAQVVSNANQISGSYEITNTHPEILDFIDLRQIRAYAGSINHTPKFTASTFALIDSPTQASFELTVEAGPTGSGVEYEISFLNGYMFVPTYIYNTPIKVSEPVEEEPAPDVNLDFEDCFSFIRVHTIDAETGDPHPVYHMNGYGYATQPTGFIHRSYSYVTNGSLLKILHPDDGVVGEMRVTVWFRDFEELPYLNIHETFEIPANSCDQIYDFYIEIPEDGREIEYAALLGELDIVGEEMHSSNWRADGSTWLLGPGPIDLDDDEVPAPQKIYPWAYNMFSGRGYNYQRSATTSDFNITVQPGETFDLADAFQMIPGRIQSDVHLVGPPDILSGNGESCLADLYRDLDTDSNLDGIPNNTYLDGGTVVQQNSSRTAAPGAAWSTYGGYLRRAFSGSYDSNLAELRGGVDLAAVHVYNDDAVWEGWYTRYVFTDQSSPSIPESYLSTAMWLRDDLAGPIITSPGQTTRQRDIHTCFGEVQLDYISRHGTFYQPALTGTGNFEGMDFTGAVSDDHIYQLTAYGTPRYISEASDEGLVRTCLPQGLYNLTPSIIALNPSGGTSNQTLENIELEVQCRQVVRIRSDLQLALEEVPRCVADPEITLSGSVNGTFEIDSIVAEVDGDASTGCTDCGTNPSYEIPVTLNPCTNSISVTATDSRGTIASASTTSSVDTEPPTISGCHDIEVSVQTPVPGTTVTFSPTGTDTCDGTRPATCDIPSGSFFPIGETLVSCVATDQCGFTDPCTFTVTVNEEPIQAGNDSCFYDDFDDDVFSGAWGLHTVGDAGSVDALEDSNGLHLTGTGSSLYHDPGDHGAFAWRATEPGDFRVEIDVTGVPLDAGGTYRKATLMARADLSSHAPRVAVSYVPHFPGGAAVMFDVRHADGTTQALASTLVGIELPVRLAIERRDDTLTVFISEDAGSTWIRPSGGLGGSVELDLGDSPRVGPMVTSYDLAQPVTFTFDGFSLCAPSAQIPNEGGVCDGSDLDIIYLLDQSGSMGELLADGTPKADAVRSILQRMGPALDLHSDHRAAVISATAEAPPFDAPTVLASTLQGFTTDFMAIDQALSALPAPAEEDATPLADGLRRAHELLQNTASAERRPTLLWVTDGLPTVDGSGHGPAFYEEHEIRSIPLRHPDGSFRSAGDVAWDGDLNPAIHTHDGEAPADTMAVIGSLLAEFPDLRIVTLLPSTPAQPGYPDLPDFAAHFSSGAVVQLSDGSHTDEVAAELLSALLCGEDGSATLGGTLWQDTDGDGEIDGGEVGLDGVTVRLLDAASAEVANTVTTGGGVYQFGALAPGTYTISVDPSSLPAGLDQRTYDSDGISSADQSTLDVEGWDVVLDRRFGYRATPGPLSGCIADDFVGSLDPAWSLASLGDADQSEADTVGDTLHLTGDGSSLYAGTDHGAFLYRTVTSDFVAEIDVEGFPVDDGGAYHKGGLMVRTGLGSTDPRIMVQYIPRWNNGSQSALQFRYRATAGGAGDGALGSNLFTVPLPARLRISRNADIFRVAYSTDGGATWNTPSGGSGGSVQLSWDDTLLVGANVVSYHPTVTTTAAFDDFRVCEPTTP